MAKAAEVIGQAARTAEDGGELISNYRGRSDYHRGDYRGEVRDGHAHGVGVLRWSNGYYVSEKGDTLDLPAGSVDYEGEWRSGVRHGLGVMRYPNGNIRHAGQWNDRNCHGLGVSWSVRHTLHHCRLSRLP
eukprot:GHVU01149313.1.p1 GENE.GHVU01149313.1~~GHVU01149313.1.p1  ORF type:complete len:145 (+),score=12.44 GHVU01149313.1:45-437(+)